MGRGESPSQSPMNGYIKIHRSLLKWEWYDDINTCRLWLHLLLKANFKPTKWHGVELSPGQLITGRVALSKETGLSVQQVRTSLDKLKSTSNITIKATSHFTLVTVANWAKFQCDDEELTSEATGNQPTNNQQITNNQPQRKNDKKEKNDKKDNITPLSPLEKAIEDFKSMRVKIKKPMTPRAVTMLTNRLTKLAGDDEALKIAILEQSIFKSWQDVYELKNDMVTTQPLPHSKPKRYKIITDENGKEVSVLDE